MAHNLTQNENGKYEFFSAVTRGWHQLGQLSEGKLTTEEALEVSLCNFEVEKVPLLHEVEGLDGIPQYAEVPDSMLVRRTDNLRPLGVVSPRFENIQNRDAMRFADELIGSGQAVWDTAGSLAGGRIVFMQMELEGHLFLKNRPDDKTIKRVLFMTGHDGKMAFSGRITPVRVVCQNTLNAALGNHSNCFSLKHTRNWNSDANKSKAARVLELANAYFQDLQTVMDTLESKPMDKNEIEGFATALFPASKEEVATRTENRRQEIVSLFSNGVGNLGRTRWDAFNAVTEYVDHHMGGRMTGTRMGKSETSADVEREARFERSILGSGATLKQRGLDLLLN
jgi:phage/plasmid-like protein (TIGR03299 family)